MLDDDGAWSAHCPTGGGGGGSAAPSARASQASRQPRGTLRASVRLSQAHRPQLARPDSAASSASRSWCSLIGGSRRETAPPAQRSAELPASARAVPAPQPISAHGDRRRSARCVQGARPTLNGPCRSTGRVNPSQRRRSHPRIDRRCLAAERTEDRGPGPLRSCSSRSTDTNATRQRDRAVGTAHATARSSHSPPAPDDVIRLVTRD